jgi:parallel beta helix pectate lyase-like protein
MKNTKHLLVLTVLVFFATAVPARAQATRTWVSGVGDDLNPCSRTAPCKTFAGAISKTATDGVINVLDPGGFGTVTITKALTIDGGGAEGSVLLGMGVDGIVVSNPGGSAVVTLRNLSIYGVGAGLAGVVVTGAVGGVHIEDCIMSSFTVSGIDFHPTSGVLFVSNTKILDSGVSGILVTGRQATLDNVQVEGNLAGVRAVSGSWVSIRHSSINGNPFTGLLADGGSVIDINDSIASQNGRGLTVTGGGEMLVHGTTITGNTVSGLSNDGSGLLISTGTNLVLNAVNGVFTSNFPLQ